MSLNKSQENLDQTGKGKDMLETPDLLSWAEILMTTTTDNQEDVIKSDRQQLTTTAEGQFLSGPSRRSVSGGRKDQFGNILLTTTYPLSRQTGECQLH